MQAKWRRWMKAAGIDYSGPVEIDPAYALDAEELKTTGICLNAE